MSDGTGIQWTDATWSPILGCSPASRGCGDGTGGGCYALRDVWRMAHNPNPKISGPRQGLVEKTASGRLRWTGRVALLPEQLEVPLRWREPRRIFVANQSDLFHENVPDDFILAVFATIIATPQHTYQILTKRPERARRWFLTWNEPCAVRIPGKPDQPWPLPNVWLGVSVEDQAAADERIPHLLATPAAVRFLSCEPLLGPVDLTRPCRPWGESGASAAALSRLGWIIVGGESGPRARELDVAWVRSIVEQGRSAGVPVFVKQLGCWWSKTQPGFPDPKGSNPEEWPADLRVRQMPEVTR